MQNYRRILILSNDAFNSSSSNGRTMMNFFIGYPREALAQFYIHGIPDEDFCANYYKNSDNDALRTFLFKTKNRVENNNNGFVKSEYKKDIKRNCKNYFLRNLVWQSYRWWDKEFDRFLNDFSPEVVLLQAGDAPFMFDIAVRISKKHNIPLMMFNTEYYVLKNKLYSGSKKYSLWHMLLRGALKRQYKRFMKHCDWCIYNVDDLENAYREKYRHKGGSISLYTTSEMKVLEDNSKDRFSLLYCGNLGVGRDEPLCDIARALYEVDPDGVFDIYGKFVNTETEERVCKNSNVVFHGFVDYSEIPRLMSEASILIHCENDSRLENLKYAFSTKIADSLSSGRPFLVYAGREYPFVKYLEKNNCAHIASDLYELKDVLQKCKDDREYRNKCCENAINIARLNHNKESNCKKMLEIIEKVTS